MRLLSLLLFSLISISAFSQVITIDAQFDDWAQVPIQTDPMGDASNLDLLEFSVTNDAEYLYLRIKTAEEFGLINPSYSNSQVHVYIDTDNNPNTGRGGNALGSELRVQIGDKIVDVDYPQVGAYSGSLYDIGFMSGPTVTGTEFEMAIRRDAKPDGVNMLFQSDTINLHFWSSAGDFMPDINSSFSYMLEEGPFPLYPVIDMGKSDPQHLRLMAYNVLRGGLIDPIRGDSHERIVHAMEPQIIGFTEVDGSAADIKKLLDVWYPIAGGWHTIRNRTNVVASQYPILTSDDIQPGSRSVANLIDLPDMTYSTDMLVITSHTSCCANDAARQEQIDAIASYILDAKSPGGRITVPRETPIVIMGDLNLVGWKRQLETAIEGTIVNTGLYGAGGPLDWDRSDLENAACLHAARPVFFTWRNPFSAFGPGKLDYILYSGSAMEEMKSFTLDTEELSASTLVQLGLNRNETEVASDHLPLVADFRLKITSSVEEQLSPFGIYPNPAGDYVDIQFPDLYGASGELLDIQGKTVARFELTEIPHRLDLSDLPAGVYVLKLKHGGKEFHNKLLKK